MKNNHYYQLDVFRALAALSVCAVHFNFDSFFNNHFANGKFVQLFFALSGFVIYLNYHQKINNFIDLKFFIIKRFKRLYPLHLFFNYFCYGRVFKIFIFDEVWTSIKQ